VTVKRTPRLGSTKFLATLGSKEKERIELGKRKIASLDRLAVACKVPTG